MNRRPFLRALSGSLLAAPLAAEAQQAGKIARIGYLSLRPAPSHLDEAFQQGLRELGYVDGQNITVEYRYADWNPDRVSILAEELVRLKVDIIVSTGGNAAALAVKKVVKALPVVFTSGDPVANGIVARLDRPGANLTGVNLVTTELNPKRLELLRTTVPGLVRVAVLANPATATANVLKDLQAAARSLRVTLQIVETRSPQPIEQTFLVMMRARPGALLVLANPMFLAERERIVRLASDHRLPAIFEQGEFVEAGGLLSYGPSIADKILKGAKPGDLPIEQPTKFELAVNLKTAKALGLTIPPSFLQRADQVIE